MLFRSDLGTNYVNYHSNVQIDVIVYMIFFVDICCYGSEKWGDKEITMGGVYINFELVLFHFYDPVNFRFGCYLALMK